MIIWFFLWKNEKKFRRDAYDCELCVAGGRNKLRACFHPKFGEKNHTVLFPIPADTKGKFEGEEEKNVNGEELLDWLSDFNDQFNPEAPSFEIINNIVNPRNKVRNKEICSMSFVDAESGTVIDLEDACFNYHVLPFVGGLLDQPQLLLEVFNVIRTEKERFKNIKAEKALQDAKSATNRNPKNK